MASRTVNTSPACVTSVATAEAQDTGRERALRPLAVEAKAPWITSQPIVTTQTAKLPRTPEIRTGTAVGKAVSQTSAHAAPVWQSTTRECRLLMI